MYIGDQMTAYGDDELVLLGSNLPHEWRSDIIVSPDLYSESISIHFNRDFLGDYFYSLPETSLVASLLDEAQRGIKITDAQTKQVVKEEMILLRKLNGLPRICKLLDILHRLSVCKDMLPLSSKSFVAGIDQDRDHRINAVYQYVMKNFKRQISVQETAIVVNMTATSFCRFFKERTHRSFINYLHEVRVGYACRLLLEGRLSVSQVAYESGFSNMSNFNKQFRKIKQLTPVQFISSRR